MVLDGLPSLYGLKYDSATACGLLLYLCSYKLDGSATPSRPTECPNPNDRGQGPWPHKATRQTMTQGGYLLWVRRPWELGDDDEGHNGHLIAQDD